MVVVNSTSPAQDVDDKFTLILLVKLLDCIVIICRVFCVAYIKCVGLPVS